MALQAGIVGLPNVGKSTLFNAVSNSAKAQASNYRFCTIEPNTGLVDVPDERIDKLAELVKPERTVPTQVGIVYIAGLVKGASKGEGLGNKFLANTRKEDASKHTGNKFSEALKAAVTGENAQMIVMNNSIEAQISEMDDPADRRLFMEEYKMTEPALNKLIRSVYKLLNLATYFTAGVQEVRAWTIQDGWKAPQAASVIHTDFEKGFIKAEVIAYKDYIQYGSEAAARDNGKLRIEGKEYVVKDGDVMHFRIDV